MDPDDGHHAAIAALDAVVRQRIRFLRTRRGLTQQDISAKLGISQKQYMNLESGVLRLSPAMTAAITRELNCSLDDLFPQASVSPQALASAERIEMLKAELRQLIIETDCIETLIALKALLLKR